MSLAFTVSVWRFAAVKFSLHPSSAQQTLTRQELSVCQYFSVTVQAEGKRARAFVFRVWFTLNKKGSTGTTTLTGNVAFTQLLLFNGKINSTIFPKGFSAFETNVELNSPFARVTGRSSRLKLVKRLSSSSMCASRPGAGAHLGLKQSSRAVSVPPSRAVGNVEHRRDEDRKWDEGRAICYHF